MLRHRRHLILLCPSLFFTLLAHSQQSRQDTITLYFAFNSYQLQPGDSARLLAAFGDLYTGSISITGYTDKVGTAAYNRNLSEHRANAAAACLRTQGFGKRFTVGKVTGAGIAPTPERSDSENRRVEIIYFSKVLNANAGSHDNPVPHHDTVTRNSGIGPTIRRRSDSIVVVKRSTKKDRTGTENDSTAEGRAPADSARPTAVLALRHINFIVDTPIPTDSTSRILPEFVTELLQFKDHQLEIDGYVNSVVPLRGARDPLFILSVRRAKFIYDYLVNAGFDPGKLTYKGMGNASPINPHPTTKQEMDANMRVEIKVY
jgi:outer membrane protein OmpA-like peptidoglycan-associated protein